MPGSVPARRLALALVAVALVAALLLGARPGVEALSGHGLWGLWPQTDEAAGLPDGIAVRSPGGDDALRAGAGGTSAPGPDATPLDSAVPAVASFGAEPLSGAATSDERPGTSGVLRLPNLRVSLGAIVAHAGGADSAFVYRAAIEARDAGEYRRAVELLDAVTASGGVLAPFASLRAAQTVVLLESTTDPVDATGPADLPAGTAAERFAALLTPAGGVDRLPAGVQAVALIEGARALDVAGRATEALAALDGVDALAVGAGTLAEAAAERARLLEASGSPLWIAAAVRAMELAPGSAASQAALDLIDERGAAYPGMVGAYVAYRSFRNDDATARYEALVDSGALTASEASVAWFYLGALRERAYEGTEALAAYAASIEADPDGPLAPDARYWRGRVMEELGWPGEAVAEYDLLVAEFPASRFVEDARLRAAVALGLAEDGAAATARLADLTRTGSPGAAAEAAHWHAVLVELFDAPPADVAPAMAYDPTSYAAAFEQSGHAVTGPLPVAALDEPATTIPLDRVAIELWLADRGRPREATSAVLQAPEVRLAWTLTAAGESGVARGLLLEEIGERREESYELLALATRATERGLHDIAMRAAQAILAPFSPMEQLEAPRSLLGLAYPVPYFAETQAAAEEFGVPVLLLYALMRQESAFHPEAGSSAGAFGLTQVILPTGEYIAAALGEDEWQFLDLARPEVATRFGAYYLALQLAEFDGHMLAALAAYNGGPGNAARWLQSQQFAGPDGYLYAVDFTETRLYLELVSANYAMYRFIYLGLPTPQLPH